VVECGDWAAKEELVKKKRKRNSLAVYQHCRRVSRRMPQRQQQRCCDAARLGKKNRTGGQISTTQPDSARLNFKLQNISGHLIQSLFFWLFKLQASRLEKGKVCSLFNPIHSVLYSLCPLQPHMHHLARLCPCAPCGHLVFLAHCTRHPPCRALVTTCAASPYTPPPHSPPRRALLWHSVLLMLHC
jgi:hypothetical protein